MFCSTIIPTIGRSTLSRAVHSVLDQEFTAADFEVVVVNDSGQPLPEADWQRSERVQILHTMRRERSVARNAGAAVAQGNYLHFLDDDDWLLAGALATFWKLARTSDATWLYGGSQLVDRAGNPLIELHHHLQGNCFVQVMAGEWIPLQSSLIKAEVFFVAGGFDPLLAGPEDIDLCRRILLHRDLAGTPATVACIGMGTADSTTNPYRQVQYRRQARETTLDAPGAFARLRASAHSSYWHGHVVRVYLTSAAWNLQHRRVCTAASRAAFGAAGCFLAGLHAVSPGFWRGVMRAYESPTFARGFQEANSHTG